jgi:hypothetical protein
MSHNNFDIHFPHKLPPLSFAIWEISQLIASCTNESITGTLCLKRTFFSIIDLKQA